jgi:hypothetical protein
MKREQDIFNDIQNKGLRPWLDINSIDEVFSQKFHSLKVYTSNHHLQYQLTFERPIDYKTKYYQRLILNTLKMDFDIIFKTIDEDRDESLILYWLDNILNKRLKTQLRDIGTLIKQKDFALSYINPKNTSYQIDQQHKADTYIMQLLKLALMQLYLEVQEAFKDWVADELIVEDFYTQLLLEPIPEKLPIQKIQILEIEPEPVKKRKPKKEVESLPFYSFSYKQYPTHQDKLTDLWDSLKLNNFISTDTPLPTFKKIFSGTEINNPVKWKGKISELYYFIKLIYTDFKLVENLKQKQWQVTCICFVNENGEPFSRSQFRSLKRPNLTGDKIDKAVNLLK